MSDNCRVEFLIYTLPHPGARLVLVMAAVFTRCNWTTVVIPGAACHHSIWPWLSPDISREDFRTRGREPLGGKIPVQGERVLASV